VTPVSQSLASAITRAASKQTYYTIRLLVDRPLVQDAFRAYAYFRWVDDVVDAEACPGQADGDAERPIRAQFLERQRILLDACLLGERPPIVDPHEALLVELVRRDPDPRLDAYLRHMMLVMAFDVGRRGRLVSQHELGEYTRWLAVAVTEAMSYFIGNGAESPHDETRYQAVTGAHIVHMLRDTYADLAAGYVNVPREVLEASSIGPADVERDPYRAWVSDRVRLARAHLDVGKDYFARVESRRHRLAGVAYIARFEWLIETLEREDFRLRPDYGERRGLATQLQIGRSILGSLTARRRSGHRAVPLPVARAGRP